MSTANAIVYKLPETGNAMARNRIPVIRGIKVEEHADGHLPLSDITAATGLCPTLTTTISPG